jgi:hypothetical protein
MKYVGGGGGYAVAQLVEALRYKSEGRGFDSRWGFIDFSFTYSFRPHWGRLSLLTEMCTKGLPGR